MWSMMGRKFRCEIRDAWLLIAISPLEEEALWDLFFVVVVVLFVCLLATSHRLLDQTSQKS